MCGIAGAIFLRDPLSQAELRQSVERAIQLLSHRGPDGQGVWTGEGIGLGHSRLSVIDLSHAADQPMTNDDASIVVTFNGEIYNFRELRAELEGAGYRFRSHSDTEVLVHGYAHWGRCLPERLRGMFAFAVWDTRQRSLFLARDRLGKKPLYYFHDGRRLLFASEIKAITCWPEVPRQPDLHALHHYLTFQYTPSPWTAFQGICRLPPASTLFFAADGSMQTQKYWHLPEPRAAKPRRTEELKEELVAQIRDAVAARLISDVPLGAFLSGGVDSSAVVAMMATLSADPVKTFTIGFEEKEYDETRYAQMVADRYGTDHHVLTIHPDALAVIPKLAWFFNEPFADSSAIPTYYVSELARRHVTVVLNGDGGDEALLGYGRYAYCADWPRRVAPPWWTGLLHRLPLGALPARIREGLAGRLASADTLYSQRYAVPIAFFHDHQKEEAYGEALRPYLAHSSLDLLEPYFAASDAPAAGAAWADIHTYLPDDLLVKVDIASMAHALEARSPLLDHKVYEWAAAISPEQKMWGGETKALFKSAMEPYLPREVLYRPKMGFGVPIDRWLRTELRDFAHDLLLSPQCIDRGLVRREYVARMLAEHCEGRVAHTTRLWALIMLEMWYRTWIDRSSDGPLAL